MRRLPFGDLIERGEFDAALHALATFFLRLVETSDVLGTDFPFPEFDAACCEIGRRSGFELFARPPDPPDVAHDVVLVTEACVQGGHAEIIRDIAEWNTRPLLIVATNLLDRRAPLLAEITSHSNVLGTVELEGSFLARLRDAQAMLQAASLRRVHVLCHAHDAVAVAASVPGAKPVLFFHHCDHGPCLGCFLPEATHVDLHNLGFDRCRRQLGLDPRYVCLTSRETTPGRAETAFAYPRFKSATCGGEHKLIGRHYPIGYADVLVRLIRSRGGVHYHVGLLSDGYVATLRERLHEAGLSANSFIHVGHVAGFREIVAALEIDLYLPTLPQSGGKAMVDAMSAGIPILAHDNAIDRLWGSRDLIYPAARSWATLDRFEDELARFNDKAHWRAQAAASFEHYQEYHGNALFARQLEADGVAFPPPLPPNPYRPDLGLCLDLHGLHDLREALR